MQEELKLEKERLDLLINGAEAQRINAELLRELDAQRVALRKGTLEALDELEEQRLENRRIALNEIINDEKKSNE